MQAQGPIHRNKHVNMQTLNKAHLANPIANHQNVHLADLPKQIQMSR